MTILLKGGEVVDPIKETVEPWDMVVERGKVGKLLQPGLFKESDPRHQVIDASGKLIVPGLIDMHVHLREPGYEHKETIATGAKAGVAGGFTGLACMPNTEPVNDHPSVTEFILEKASGAGLLRVYPIGAITKGQKGTVLCDFEDLKAAGVVGVSDDGFPVSNSDTMRRAMEHAGSIGLIAISHCEDVGLSAGGVMHEGIVSNLLGLRGIPAESEEIMVHRDISLARLTGCPVHIAHVSTRIAVEAIRRAKEEGLPVTAETAPHYFSLDHEAVMGYNTGYSNTGLNKGGHNNTGYYNSLAKMNPPLRTQDDVQAIKRGLAEDVIDVIATDHAPHSPAEKNLPFDKAAFGIIGLETALPLTLALVREGVLSLPTAIKKMSYNPATLLGVDGGRLEVGSRADLAIVDPDYEYILDEDMIQSKSRNSPFIGRSMKGINTLTMIEGRIVWERVAQHTGG